MKYIVAECLGCKDIKEIKANEIQKGEQPICNKCGMPMIPLRAIWRKQ